MPLPESENLDITKGPLIISRLHVFDEMQGDEPDIDSVAKIVLNDFQRGRLPYFVMPDV